MATESGKVRFREWHARLMARTRSEDVAHCGCLRIQQRREGKLIAERRISNLVVTAGKEEAAKLLVGDGGTPFTYIALGTGTESPEPEDTTLQNEITDSGLARAEGTVSTDGNVASIAKTFNVTGTKAVTEAGLFNADEGGVMFARVTFAALNVEDGDTLTYTWQITCG